MPYFNVKFESQLNSERKIDYSFNTLYKQTEQNRNEKLELFVDGYSINMNETLSNEEELKIFKEIPEECFNPSVSRRILETWLQECGSSFTKCPTLEHCLSNLENHFDESALVAPINAGEEDESWILQWIPTRIIVRRPKFQIWWAPCYKILNTRIPELEEFEEKIPTSDYHEIQLNLPDKNPIILDDNSRLIRTSQKSNAQEVDWLQEINDSSLPYSDSPDLRLNLEVDTQREKFRRRVRDARIRAKLAKYRAERLAHRYEVKFGDYPEEDEEEGQTEVEESEED
jgi:hypothetical protein